MCGKMANLDYFDADLYQYICVDCANDLHETEWRMAESLHWEGSK
jgi:hypothetical protein